MPDTVKCLTLQNILSSFLLNLIVIHIICFQIVTCQNSYGTRYNFPEGVNHEDVTVKFPHLNFRVVQLKLQHEPDVLQEQIVNNGYSLPYELYKILHHEPCPSYFNYNTNPQINEQQYNLNHYYPSARNIQPPINFNIPNQDQADPQVGVPKPPLHNHKQNTWYYSLPAWQNNNMNILRSPDPRSLIASHSSFVKIHKPFHGSFIKTKHKKVIIDDHHPVHHFAPPSHTTINKNTHVHVHSRNAEENAKITREEGNRFLGSHLFSAPRWRRDTLNRKRRGLIEVAKLVANPKTRVDVGETAKNLGAATRDLFEDDRSPVYHMRNVLGSSQDAVYSLMKARPTGLLVPSRYKIVHANEDPTVGAINPGVYARTGREPHEVDENQKQGEIETGDSNTVSGNTNPLHKAGNMILETVQWAQKSAEHAADAMHSARQVVVTAKKHWPQLLLPYAGALQVKSPNRDQDCEIVEAARDPQFVGMGKILDSLGLTDVQPNYEPMLAASQPISEEVQMLNNARASLGVTTYKQFMEKMKKELERLQKRNDMVKLALPKPKLLPISRLRSKLPPPKLPIPKITPKYNPALANYRSALNAAKVKAKLAPALARLRTPVRLRPKPGRLLAAEPRLTSKSEQVLEENVDDTEVVGSPIEQPKASPVEPKLKGSSKVLEEIDPTLEPVVQASGKLPGIASENEEEELEKRLEELRKKLREKLEIANDDTHMDILGKALEILEKKNEQGSRNSADEQVQSIPMPMFTKEMKIPFMGFATKDQLEKYYRNMFCPDCKLSKVNELLEATSN